MSRFAWLVGCVVFRKSPPLLTSSSTAIHTSHDTPRYSLAPFHYHECGELLEPLTLLAFPPLCCSFAHKHTLSQEGTRARSCFSFDNDFVIKTPYPDQPVGSPPTSLLTASLHAGARGGVVAHTIDWFTVS